MGSSLFGLLFRYRRIWFFAQGEPTDRTKDDENYSSQIYDPIYKALCRFTASKSLVCSGETEWEKIACLTGGEPVIS